MSKSLSIRTMFNFFGSTFLQLLPILIVFLGINIMCGLLLGIFSSGLMCYVIGLLQLTTVIAASLCIADNKKVSLANVYDLIIDNVWKVLGVKLFAMVVVLGIIAVSGGIIALLIPLHFVLLFKVVIDVMIVLLGVLAVLPISVLAISYAIDRRAGIMESVWHAINVPFYVRMQCIKYVIVLGIVSGVLTQLLSICFASTIEKILNSVLTIHSAQSLSAFVVMLSSIDTPEIKLAFIILTFFIGTLYAILQVSAYHQLEK